MWIFFYLFVILFMVIIMSHYFINDNNLKEEKRIINSNLLDICLSFNTNSGVFSKEKVDYGTRLLLNNIDVVKMHGNVLDLGCGFGVIGITIAKKNKYVNVDMVDVNERAINLAKSNVLLNNVNVNVFVSDIYSNVNRKYDYIITNPPIRAGKEIVLAMLLGSISYLKEDGTLYFVMRKDHGVKSTIKKLEEIFKVEIVCRDKGFYIVKCSK